MTIRRSAPHAKGRWSALLVVGTMLLLVGAQAALANLPGSTFEGGDGNLVVNTAGNTDWANVAGLHAGVDQPSGTSDNSFGQGTKEDSANTTVVTGSIPPNKNDLTRFYEASETVGGDTLLYLAWERAVNIGNANLDFEINQKATVGFTGTTTGKVTLNRTAGDLLVTYDFAGSGTPTIGLLRWLTSASVPVVPGFATNACFSANSFPCWGDQKTLDATEAEGAVNSATNNPPSGTIVDPIPPNAPRNLGVGLFGEAAINLTDAGVFPTGGPCLSLGSTFVKSRSSSSFPAEIKDFIAPVPVNISNCGEIKIIKNTDPRNIDQNFSFSTTVPSTGNNAATFSKAVDSDGPPATFTLNDKTGGVNVEDITNVHPGSYTVTEGTEPAHFTLKSLECSAGGEQDSTVLEQANITVAAGDVVTCTYTNEHQKASPTVATIIVPAGPAAIGATAHDTAQISGATGDAGGTISYTLYSNNDCTGVVADLTPTVNAVAAGVAPDSKEVTFTGAGTFYFYAVYSGDGNNNGPVNSGCAAEPYTVNPNSPTVNSTPAVKISDYINVTGFAAPPAGSTVKVLVGLYSNSGCTTQIGTNTEFAVPAAGGAVTGDTTFVAALAGDYYYKISYAGDTNNGSFTSCLEHVGISITAVP